MDLTYDISVSSSKNFLFSTIQSRNESEVYVLPKDAGNAQFELLIPRQKDVYNEVREFDGTLYNLTNDHALNNRLLVRNNDGWTELVPHSKGRFIKDFIITKNYIVLNTFQNGLTEIRYARKNSKKWEEIELPNEICEVDLLWSRNDSLSIEISSPRLPFTRYLFDLQQEKLHRKQSTKIKRTLDYYPKTIKTERLWVKVK